MRTLPYATMLAALAGSVTFPAAAADFNFSSGSPDGLIATASGPSSGQLLETETADDFRVPDVTRLSGGAFTGLLPTGLSLAGATAVKIEFYRIFPDNSAAPSGHVLTRDNSPADNDFLSRSSASSEISYTTTLLNPAFSTVNSVVSNISRFPDQFRGGEGAVTGQEVRFDFIFDTDVTLDPGHYFFVPQVTLSDGSFLWLSAAKPIVAPGTPFAGDLQTWIRNENLTPDWSRVGTDITHQGPFNASFELTGSTVPEPATWALLITGFGMVGAALRRRSAAVVAA